MGPIFNAKKCAKLFLKLDYFNKGSALSDCLKLDDTIFPK
jgi:hypothetical protein